VHLLALGLVLDQLDEVAAVDHGTGRGCHVHPDLEAGGVHLRGPAAVVPDVVDHVAQAAHQALAAGVERLPDRGRVAGQRVRGREHVEDELRGEPSLDVLAGVQLRGVQQLVDQLVGQQVLLLEEEVQRVLRIGQVLEPLVTLGRRHRTFAVAADRATGGCAHRGQQADQQPHVGCGGVRGVLGQTDTRGGQRPQERHRVGTDQRVLRDAEALQDRGT
jgi:hypothetical protein